MSKKMQWHVVGFLLATIPLAAFSGYSEASQGPNPELIYNALDIAEWRLAFRDPDTGFPRVGGTVLERSVGGLLCRKTSSVIPEPVPHFQCYIQLTLQGAITSCTLLRRSRTRCFPTMINFPFILERGFQEGGVK